MFFLLISQLDTVDRIVAVVGDRAFWMSEVDEIALIYGGAMGITPDKLGEFRKAVLEELVNMELLYLKVRQDTTIKVSDQEINQALDQQINVLMGKLKKEEFEERLKEAGLTVDYLREYYRDFVQRNLYIQKFVEMKVKPNIKVSDEEVMNFYKTYKDSLKQPDEYKIAVISFIVKPSASEEQEYYRRAKNIYERLKKGEDFSRLALQMSDDRESAQNGGNLGVIPKNALPPDFINEIEKTPVGGITKPLRGPQGYHIFKVLGKQDDSYLLAHILVKVKPSQKAKDNVMARAKRVANLAKAGQDFSKLARTYSEDPISRENGGDIGWVSEVVLPKNLAESLRNAKVGDIVGPIESPDGLTINIFKVLDKRGGKEPTYEEIRNVVLSRKIDEQLKKLIEDAKKEFYYKINL
ncbi:peptidylprolyl isomerase [Candidatus Caldipriscus sp.]|nr:peptidylprolyl isomerase [Candidatus Caldipriscus sp.]